MASDRRAGYAPPLSALDPFEWEAMKLWEETEREARDFYLASTVEELRALRQPPGSDA
jgi:hypothetical protein